MADIDLSRKKKVNTKDSGRQSVIAQWGIPVLILFVVVIVLVSNFSVISKNSAKESVSKKLITDSSVYADSIENMLMEMTYAGQSASALIGDMDSNSLDSMQRYAELIRGSIPTPYMVAIVNMEGVGSSNASAHVDLSSCDYFVSTATQTYVFTEDDGLTGNKAFISVVPVYHDREAVAMIYLYADTKRIEAVFPSVEYDGYPSFAIINAKGDLMTTAGEVTYFTEGSSFTSNLRMSQLLDLSFSKITMRIGKQIKFAFTAQKGQESKTIICVPIGIGDWQYVTVLNQNYVDLIEYNEWTNARNMVTNLSIAVCVFLGLIIIMSIINKLRYNEQSKDLADKADTDLLTELNNKMATERKIQEFLDENPDSQSLMFLFDIDNFKKINDTMGHAFGDEVLRSLGQQLRNEFRVTDIIGRTGGDEFILFLKFIKSDEQLEREGVRISNFFHQFTAGEYVKYSATASIGATVYPRDAKDFQGLYRAADSALYEAKRRGKNQLVFYNKELENTSMELRREVPIDNDGRKK